MKEFTFHLALLKFVIIGDLTEILLWAQPLDVILLELLEAWWEVYRSLINVLGIVTILTLHSVLCEIKDLSLLVPRPLLNVVHRFIHVLSMNIRLQGAICVQSDALTRGLCIGRQNVFEELSLLVVASGGSSLLGVFTFGGHTIIK